MRGNQLPALLYGLVVLLLALFGARYLLAMDLASHHAAALSISQPLAPGDWAVFRALYAMMGVAMLGLAALLAVIVIVPFRRGERWARNTLTTVSVGFSVAAFAILLNYYLATAQANVSAMVACLVAIALAVAAHLLSQNATTPAAPPVGAA
ncbi:hypothetical protein [Aliihoeflea sp. 2WW]|uniref:hypothetical protein n=1 Tax=Aliihoeflea sp. 2WW TaxID=1381123 RepID=UPI0004642288|nr:hypothetical protein [Aliihoeflea sp. 2WW]